MANIKVLTWADKCSIQRSNLALTCNSFIFMNFSKRGRPRLVIGKYGEK